MYILKQVPDDILREIGSHPVESGGIIGCRGDLICAFRFDGTFTSQYQYIRWFRYAHDLKDFEEITYFS